MKFDVKSISDFLPYSPSTLRPLAIETLSPAELKSYDEQAEQVVQAFNAANPDGLRLRVKIERLNAVPNRNGRIAIVVAPHEHLNNTAFTYPVNNGNAMAQSFGLPTFATLASILMQTSHDPSFLEMTIKAVSKGAEYTKGDGTKAKYKTAGIVTVEREEIKLSKAALARIGQLTQKADEQELLEFRRSMANPVPTPAPVVSGNDDDDVIGG